MGMVTHVITRVSASGTWRVRADDEHLVQSRRGGWIIDGRASAFEAGLSSHDHSLILVVCDSNACPRRKGASESGDCHNSADQLRPA